MMMMTKIIFILTILIAYSCGQNEVITYEQALQNHKTAQEKKQLANPGQFVYVGYDSFIGARMPDSIGKLISGESVDQQFIANKITLFNFWFEGCPPCLGEIPELNEIVRKFGKEKFNFVAVGRETDQNAIAVIANHNWQFNPLANGDVIIEKKFRHRWGYPTTMVVNQHGIIVSMWSAIYEDNVDAFVHHLDSLRNQL